MKTQQFTDNRSWKTIVFTLFLLVVNALAVQSQTPKVSTETYYTRGSETAFVKGQVIPNGAKVIEWGLCYGQKEHPSPEDNKKVELSSPFMARIDGLKPNTRYYARSYAKTDKGYFYGNEIEVVTLRRGNITFGVHGFPAGDV